MSFAYDGGRLCAVVEAEIHHKSKLLIRKRLRRGLIDKLGPQEVDVVRLRTKHLIRERVEDRLLLRDEIDIDQVRAVATRIHLVVDAVLVLGVEEPRINLHIIGLDVRCDLLSYRYAFFIGGSDNIRIISLEIV